MWFSTTLFFLAAVASTVHAASCAVPAPSCVIVSADVASSCSSVIAASTKQKTCTVTSSVPGAVSVSTKTMTTTSTVNVGGTTTRTILVTNHRSTQTSTSVTTSTATITTTVTTTSSTTLSPTSYVPTTTAGTTTSIYSASGPVDKRNANVILRFDRRAAVLSSDCSCFLTTTVTTTTTGKAVKSTTTTTVTTTVSKTSLAKATTAITYAQTTVVTTTVVPATSTTVSTEQTVFTSVLDTVTVVTTTVTTTSTVYTTVIPTPDISCNNAGLQYALDYNQPQNINDPAFEDFNTDYYKTDKYDAYGSTYSTSFNTGNDQTYYSAYGQPARDVQRLGINERGYLYAYQTGTYVFDLQYSDDVVAVWVGDVAYSGYNRQNTNLFGTYSSYKTDYNRDMQFSIFLAGATYTPFRIITANTGGPGGYTFVLSAPDGTQIAGFSSDASTSQNYLVQFSCDGVSAPQFPAYGQES